MNGFLRETAQSIQEKYPDLSQVVLVFPNRRAGLFFTKHLGQMIHQAQWMPKVKTIEEIFYGLAGQRPADQLTLIFELYRAYKVIHPSPEPFDRFYYWGEMILKDFNDLDNFLVDPGRLYHQLEEIKSIESDLSYLTDGQIKLIKDFWGSFVTQGKEHQEKFLKFWKLLKPLYQQFQSALEVGGLAYSGRLYRKVAESLEDIEKPSRQYIFIGFNAFTLAEEKLIKHYIKAFGAEIYWDVDRYYLDDPAQEAGMFFRQYQKDSVFGPTFPQHVPDRIREKKVKIHVHATPLKVNQANLVGQLTQVIKREEPLEESVVILPDEQMLFPVLHALPETISKVNVTMGYPVKNAPVYGFLEALLELQKFASIKEETLVFYHKPVRAILGSPFLRTFAPEFVMGALRKIEETNQVYVAASDLGIGGDFFKLVFDRIEAPGLFTYLKAVIRHLNSIEDMSALQQNYLYQCYIQLNRLEELFKQQEGIEVSLDFFIRLFRQVFREVRLPFEGEPLEGLQVMGVLESRNLDFRRVVVCNMNEDSFPPGGGLNSMVPFNLRRAFGLPVQEQNDAIYAYTFYRLLHSAEEVHLVYTTASEQGKAGEKSRYIQQLALESGLDMVEEVVFVPVDLKATGAITIPKTEKVQQVLGKYEVGEEQPYQSRLSPSALNVWLDCRLKFYFQYIAGIVQKEEVQEEIDPAVFGNLAHYSLEFLYQGFCERKKRWTLEKGDFQSLRKDWVGPAVEKAIREHYGLGPEDKIQFSGQLIIARDVLQRYVDRILEIDEATAPFEILSLEGSSRYHADVAIDHPEGNKLIGLRGIIDRVDRVGETIRLIDYKSGQDKKEFLDMASLFDREKSNRNKAAMQTMMYGLLYKQTKNGHVSAPLQPAVFNLRDIFNENFDPYLKMGEPRKSKLVISSFQEHESEYLNALRKTLEELFHPEIPFDQTEDLTKCEKCTYRDICGR